MKTAEKITKREGKLLAAKSITDQRLCISSPNTSTHHSSFYEKYKDKLEEYYPKLMEEQLTADNYQERFHHFLCWEEQEHDRQLTER